MDFQLGKALFERVWVAAPASTDSADGLGPLYNARSCGGCHPRSGRASAPSVDGPTPAGLILHLSVPPRSPRERARLASRRARFIPEPTYGTQIHPLAVPGQDAEGRVTVRYAQIEVRLAGGEVVQLRRPSYAIRDLAYGPLDPDTLVSPRLAPQLGGLGLLESVPESAILALADPQDRDGDGISGRPNLVWDPARDQAGLGRFGWKAANASLDAQVQSAFARDLGLSTPQHPAGAGDCSDRQPRCLAAPHGDSPRHGGVEAGAEVVALVAHFARGLPAPAGRGASRTNDPAVREGACIFERIGCAACHRPELPVSEPPVPGEAAGPAGRIAPYTDLLLHDLGEDLADGRPEGDADGREWRTAPLRGLTWGQPGNPMTGTARGTPGYLHDGRARSLLEAILWHGGEARPSREAVVALLPSERATLLRFLESI